MGRHAAPGGLGGPIALAGLLGLAAALAAAGPVRAETEVYEAPRATTIPAFEESAALQPEVAAGRLPPMAERVPAVPSVVPGTRDGVKARPGGALRTLIGRAKDTRLLVVYGYARLVGYDEDLRLVPDILEKVEVEDGRTFTLRLRKGHKWSDGRPFTTEDFRYWWEDVANNEELSPSGPPVALIVDSRKPSVEVLDEVTLRFGWHRPNPFFLPALAGARPLYLFRPAHYLKQFHIRYADPDALAALVKESRARNWAALHNRRDNMYRFDNPDLPTLQPWMNTTRPPSQRFVARRNPYYHRIDDAGRQLPYIDKVILDVANNTLIPAKAGSGDADLQSRGLNFSDVPFLKANEARGGYRVRLWRTVRGSQVALYPNLNANDPVWRKLLRDVRFRRALSLAIDRAEINESIYFGMGNPGNQSVLPESPFYQASQRAAYAEFDLKQANALLDSIGLSKKNGDGIRLLPDGRAAQIVIETAGENPQEVDILELITDSWRRAGIKLFTKPSQREVLRNRIFAGDTLMMAWLGYENAVPTAQTSPEEFAPTSQHGYHWPKWGQHYETGGRAGEEVDMPLPKELLELYRAWEVATSQDERDKIWRRMLAIHAEQVYTIGIVAQVPQPVLVSNALKNVPEEGIYNWDPGALFGIYRPDSFWLDR
jgi:peptide/nickel transport system substrate-binding protein